MKSLIFLVLLTHSLVISGQQSKKDSLLRETNNHIEKVYRAAVNFLDKNRNPSDRMKAIEPYSQIYDTRQIAEFKNTALDNQEPPEIRAVALRKIFQFAADDEKIQNLVFELLGNPRSQKVLRQEALDVAASLSFTSMDVLEIYQKLLEDPEPEFRLFGFTQLIIHGDARAQQLLIRGLENPEAALLPAHTAIQVLSMSVKNEYYPVVYKVVQETKDEDVRLAAIRSLGFYKEARPLLTTISRDANEKEQFREAALGALYGGDKENIVEYVMPVLTDRSASPRLQSIGIQMTIDVRQSMAYRERNRNKKPDTFDLLIKEIAEGNGVLRSEMVQQLANKYIQSVKPAYE